MLSKQERSIIQGLYETHLDVKDIERSVAFYQKLGLKLGIQHAKGAFFWVTKPQEQMLALWQAPQEQPMIQRHLGFQISLESLLAAEAWLKERGIPLVPNFGREPIEPIVHPWMPAATVYFEDPDGHSIKLLAMLPGEPRQMPGVLYYSEWLALQA